MVRVVAVTGDYYHPSEWAKESLERENPTEEKEDLWMTEEIAGEIGWLGIIFF